MPNLNELAITAYVIYASSISATLLFAARSLTRKKLNGKSSSSDRRPRRIQFNNHHGISGIASTILTCLAIAAHRILPSSTTTSLISVLSAISSISTASSGTIIVEKAPRQTVVMERPIKVVPPHRDAFKRTAYSIYYLSARICRNTMKLHVMLVIH